MRLVEAVAKVKKQKKNAKFCKTWIWNNGKLPMWAGR